MKIQRVYTTAATQSKAALLVGLKAHLRILSTDFDTTLTALLGAAIDHAESSTGCIFLESTFTLSHTGSSVSKGGFFPLGDLTSATFNTVDVATEVKLNEGRVEYSTYEEGAIEMVFEAGYDTIPDVVKAAIYLIASSLFNNPADRVDQLPTASVNLLRPYRRWQM